MAAPGYTLDLGAKAVTSIAAVSSAVAAAFFATGTAATTCGVVCGTAAAATSFGTASIFGAALSVAALSVRKVGRTLLAGVLASGLLYLGYQALSLALLAQLAYLGFLSFGLGLFFITMLAETSRVPFDTPEAEGEIVAGFNTEYGSIYFSMFVLAEYGNAVAIALLAIVYFQLPTLCIVLYVGLYSMCRSVLPRVR